MTHRTKRRTNMFWASICSPLELKSLEDIWITLIATVLQLICMWRAFDRIQKYTNETWQPFEKPVSQLVVYGACLVISVCLLPIMIWSGLVKIGAYANDRFKFGLDLDTKRIVKSEFIPTPRFSPGPKPIDQRPKSMTFTSSNKLNGQLKRYNSSSAGIDSFVVVESSLSSESASPPPNINKFEYFSDTGSSSGISLSPSRRHQRSGIINRLKSIAGLDPKWSSYMPLSSLIHFIISLCLIFPNVLLVSKQIEYGLRPKELDFVFSRPLQRFSETTGRPNDHQLANDPNSPLATIKYKLITALLEDNDEINYEPKISIELVNFLLAAVSFATQYASPIWHLNKLFSIFFSIHIVLFSLLIFVSFAAYEILLKFETVFSQGIRFLNGSLSTASPPHDPRFNTAPLDLPFLTTPLSLSLVFTISIVFFLISSWPIFSFAMSKYNSKYEKLRNCFLTIIETNKTLTGVKPKPNVAESVLVTTNDDHASVVGSNKRKSKNLSPNDPPTDESTPNNNKFEYLTASVSKNVGNVNLLPIILPPMRSQKKQPTSTTARSSFVSAVSESDLNSNDYTVYKSHLTALIILILICINSIFVFYDCLCLHRLTSDSIPLWSALAHALFIIWYIVLWSTLTIKSNFRIEFTQIFKLNLWYFLNKLAVMGLNVNQPPRFLKISAQQQSTNDIYSKIDRNKLDVYEPKMSPPSLAYENEETQLISSGNYDNSDYLIPNKRSVYNESNYDNPNDSVVVNGDSFPIYENYKTGKLFGQPNQVCVRNCVLIKESKSSKHVTSKPPTYSGNLKRSNHSSEQRLAPLMENSRCSSPTKINLVSEAKTTTTTVKKPQSQPTKALYESVGNLRSDNVIKGWKNKSNERLLDGEKNEYLSSGNAEYSRPLRQTSGFIHELERSRKYASNSSIKSVKNQLTELYASVNQIDVSSNNITRNQSNQSVNNDTSNEKRHTYTPGPQKPVLNCQPAKASTSNQPIESAGINSRILLKDYLSKSREMTRSIGASPSSTTNSPVNTANSGSSSSSSSTTAQETDDSGRHSMSDSPSSNPPNDPTTTGDLYSVKLVKSSPNPSAAGTFTSKCTLSSGNSVTLSQTAQNVLSSRAAPVKRPMSRSSSKDSGLLYSSHISSVKTSPSPAGSAILAANPGNCKNNSPTSITVNKF